MSFVAIEKRVRSPLVDLALFRNRAFDAVVIAGALSNVVFCFVAVFSALYLQQGARDVAVQLRASCSLRCPRARAPRATFGPPRGAVSADRLMALGLLISAVGIVEA